MQPVTTRRLSALRCSSSARIVSIDSWRASPMNAQVLTTTRSADGGVVGRLHAVGHERADELVRVDVVLGTAERFDIEALHTSTLSLPVGSAVPFHTLMFSATAMQLSRSARVGCRSREPRHRPRRSDPQVRGDVPPSRTAPNLAPQPWLRTSVRPLVAAPSRDRQVPPGT